MGLGTLRQELVSTLRETVEAQAARIAVLEGQLVVRDREIASLRARVDHLEITLAEILGAASGQRRKPTAPAAEGAP